MIIVRGSDTYLVARLSHAKRLAHQLKGWAGGGGAAKTTEADFVANLSKNIQNKKLTGEAQLVEKLLNDMPAKTGSGLIVGEMLDHRGRPHLGAAVGRPGTYMVQNITRGNYVCGSPNFEAHGVYDPVTGEPKTTGSTTQCFFDLHGAAPTTCYRGSDELITRLKYAALYNLFRKTDRTMLLNGRGSWHLETYREKIRGYEALAEHLPLDSRAGFLEHLGNCDPDVVLELASDYLFLDALGPCLDRHHWARFHLNDKSGVAAKRLEDALGFDQGECVTRFFF